MSGSAAPSPTWAARARNLITIAQPVFLGAMRASDAAADADAPLFASVFYSQPFRVAMDGGGARPKTVMELSERVFGRCVSNFVQFAMSRIAEQRVLWNAIPMFSVGYTKDAAERISHTTSVMDGLLYRPHHVLFISFEVDPPGVGADDAIRIVNSSLEMAVLPALRDEIRMTRLHLETLLTFRGFPVDRVGSMSRDEIIDALCGSHLYTHVLRVVHAGDEADVVIGPGDDPAALMAAVSSSFPRLRGGCMLVCDETGAELSCMRGVRATRRARIEMYTGQAAAAAAAAFEAGEGLYRPPPAAPLRPDDLAPRVQPLASICAGGLSGPGPSAGPSAGTAAGPSAGPSRLLFLSPY